MSGSVLEILAEAENTSRGFRRFALPLNLGVCLVKDAPAPPGTHEPPTLVAALVNISMSGLCFSSSAEFPVGAEVQITLVLNRWIYNIPAAVSRCQPSKRLGCVFYECGVQYLKSDATLRFLPVMAEHLLPHARETSEATS